MNVLQEIRGLRSAGLDSNVRLVAGLLLDSSSSSSLLERYELLVHFADSLVADEQFKRAEGVFKEALHLRHEILGKSGRPTPADPLGPPGRPPTSTSLFDKREGLHALPECVSEAETKFRLHAVYLALKQNKDALLTLETIPSRTRDAKINMSLARLYEDSGQDRAAAQCFKEVLRVQALALEAAQGLARTGMKGADVAAIIRQTMKDTGATGIKTEESNGEEALKMDGSPPLRDFPNSISPPASVSSIGIEWVGTWVHGHAHLSAGEYQPALAAFESLLSLPAFRDSAEILVAVGRTQYLQGNYEAAKWTLERVHYQNPSYLPGADLLAHLLFKSKLFKDLESLAVSLMETTDRASEAWVAMGYVSCSQKKDKRAIYLAQRAYTLDRRNVEALLLKGAALAEIKRVADAIVHFREALRLSPRRFEAHQGLVGCYLGQRRMREAVSQAKEAFNLLGHTARSLTLYATVLAKEPLTVKKAKIYLENALRVDPLHAPAVYLLAEIHASLQEFEKGAELLRKQLGLQSFARMHQTLGDFLSQLKDYQGALDQYSIALSLEPSNARALEGIQRVEKASDLGGGAAAAAPTPVTSGLRPGGAFDDMVGAESDNEAELSDGVEATGDWSDNEFG